MESRSQDKTYYEKQFTDLKISSNYEIKTLEYLIAEKDKNSAVINKLIHDSFSEIRNALQELTQGINQIVTAIQQISVAVGDLVVSVQKQRESSHQLSLNMADNLESGSRSKQELTKLNLEINTLEKNSTVIMDLIHNIDDIAEQLSILSINGAIQAARSGETGRGFAVVTSEMRKLSSSVKDTTAHQARTVEGIVSLIKESGDSTRLVIEGTERELISIKESADFINQINDQLNHVAENSEELSATVEEFSATIEEISRNVESIHDMLEVFYLHYSREIHMGKMITDATYEFRAIADGERTFESTAMGLMKYLFQKFKTIDNDPLLAMSRIFIALSFDDLPEKYKKEAENDEGFKDARYLCLLGTAGEHQLWNRIEDSISHKIIRLPENKAELTLMPMLDMVFSSFGIKYDDIIHPPESAEISMIEGYFLAEDAISSPYIPAKDFLKTHNIKSQLSLGGILPSGSVFTCFLFFKTDISPSQAESIKVLAPVLQLCFKPFDDSRSYWKNS